MTSWILTSVIALAALVLAILGTSLNRDLPWIQSIAFGGLIVALVWVPRTASDVLLSIGLALLFTIVPDSWTWKLVWFLATAGLGWVAMHWMPGGGSALVLGIVLLVAFFQSRSGIRYLTMLGRARRLDPHSRVVPKAPVAIGGKVPSVLVNSCLPGLQNQGFAAIQVRSSTGASFFAEPAILVIESEAGAVGIDLLHCELRSSDSILLSEEDRKEVARRLGNEGEVVVHQLFFLNPGADLYVVGIPDWESAASQRGYRDSPHIPVFRSRPGCRAFLVNKTQQEEHAQAWWNLTRWLGWGAASAAVAITAWLGVR